MQYFISFLEGIITFISPCLLPLLPVYITYFLGGIETDSSNKKTTALKNSLGFVLGFAIVFILLGIFAASIGLILNRYKLVLNIITGTIVILFGLNFIGVLKIGFLNNAKKANFKPRKIGFFSSVIFGMVFSVGWSPCVGAFLGSALMLSSQQGSIIKGSVMLLLYSLGLGIPFIASAILIEKLKSAFEFIKRHYKIINIISGLFLIIIGLLMATGYMGYFLSLLTF